jgi:hypothetical protein
MVGMAEIKPDTRARVDDTVGWTLLMACGAGAYVPVIDDFVGSVTRKARRMRIRARRNTQTVSLRRMARGARRERNMGGVVKLGLETYDRWKRLEFRRVGSGMARGAYRMRLVLKLRRMTAGTASVRRKLRTRSIVLLLMAE